MSCVICSGVITGSVPGCVFTVGNLFGGFGGRSSSSKSRLTLCTKVIGSRSRS